MDQGFAGCLLWRSRTTGMACPLCGEQCRCSYVAPRLGVELDLSEHDGRTSVLIDPEDYDPTEEQFAASVLDLGDEETPVATAAAAEARSRASAAPTPEERTQTAVIDEPEPPVPPAKTEMIGDPGPPYESTLSGIERIAHEVYIGTEAESAFASGDGWRDEVQSRLNSYRARRRRVPEGAMPLDFGEEEPA